MKLHFVIPALFALAVPACARWNASRQTMREPRIGGASVMLRVQHEGGAVFDARDGGRRIVGARRFSDAAVLYKSAIASRVPVAILVEPSRLETISKAVSGASQDVFLVPAPLLEVRDMKGVAQIAPRDATLMKNARIIDLSEADEWRHSRLVGSVSVDFARIVGGDRSFALRNRPIVFTCHVGNRSQFAARILAREGYRTFNVRGGTLAAISDGTRLEGSDYER